MWHGTKEWTRLDFGTLGFGTWVANFQSVSSTQHCLTERHSKRHACKKTTLYTRDLECKLYPLKLLWSFRHLFWRWTDRSMQIWLLHWSWMQSQMNWEKTPSSKTPKLELDARRYELKENLLLKFGRSQESPQKERSRHMKTCRRKVEMVQVQSFVMDSGRDTLKKQFARRYTPQMKFKVSNLDQLWILIFEPVEERLVGIWSTKFMEEWSTDPEVSSPVWVCAVSLLQYIGKEKCEHSLRSENDSAKHVLLDGLARRWLSVWCRPRHEVVSTFKCFQRIGAQPEAKAIWIWKDRSTISEHGELDRR